MEETVRLRARSSAFEIYSKGREWSGYIFKHGLGREMGLVLGKCVEDLGLCWVYGDARNTTIR